MAFFKDINDAYRKGLNISKFLESNKGLSKSSKIALSYDLQAGSYVKTFFTNYNFQVELNNYIYQKLKDNVLDELKKFNTAINICDFGTGESTNFVELLNLLDNEKLNLNPYGMDISLSRLYIANNFAKIYSKHLIPKYFLGDIAEIPLKDNSIDIALTNHAIEPNGGREEEIVNELVRVTRGFLVLTEPIYENASQKQKERMEYYGYITKLKTMLYEHPSISVIYESLFPAELYKPEDKVYSGNIRQGGFPELNRSTIIIAKKNNITSKGNQELDYIYSCPIEKTNLSRENNFWISKEGSCYPEINEVPILLSSKALPFFQGAKIY